MINKCFSDMSLSERVKFLGPQSLLDVIRFLRNNSNIRDADKYEEEGVRQGILKELR